MTTASGEEVDGYSAALGMEGGRKVVLDGRIGGEMECCWVAFLESVGGGDAWSDGLGNVTSSDSV